jgi:hypothetical protein
VNGKSRRKTNLAHGWLQKRRTAWMEMTRMKRVTTRIWEKARSHDLAQHPVQALLRVAYTVIEGRNIADEGSKPSRKRLVVKEFKSTLALCQVG